MLSLPILVTSICRLITLARWEWNIFGRMNSKVRVEKKQIEVDALGKEKKILGQTEAEDGNNLRLSLDINQQLKLEEVLISNLKKIKKTKAMAIVSDPRQINAGL